MISKRKKNTRQRGSKTHGWGAMKKHRGAGNRGGRGNAGTGKKGDAKKPTIWKKKKYFGKTGFKKKGMVKKTTYVNLSFLEQNADKLVENKIIDKKGDTYSVDGVKAGFNKVLGAGKLSKKFKIIAESFSRKAEKKIKSAGGEAVVLKKEAEVKKEPEKIQEESGAK